MDIFFLTGLILLVLLGIGGLAVTIALTMRSWRRLKEARASEHQ